MEFGLFKMFIFDWTVEYSYVERWELFMNIVYGHFTFTSNDLCWTNINIPSQKQMMLNMSKIEIVCYFIPVIELFLF